MLTIPNKAGYKNATRTTARVMNIHSEAHPWLEPTTKRVGDCFSQQRPRMLSCLSLERPEGIDEQTMLLATSATIASPARATNVYVRILRGSLTDRWCDKQNEAGEEAAAASKPEHVWT